MARRSGSLTEWRSWWRVKRLLLVAAVAEMLFAAAILFVDSFATFFDQAAPPLVGWLIAIGSMPVILLADAIVKRSAAGHRQRARSG